MNVSILMTRILYGVCLLSVGCTTAERPPTDNREVAASAMEVPVIPDEPAHVQQPPSEATGSAAGKETGGSEAVPPVVEGEPGPPPEAGDVQERAVRRDQLEQQGTSYPSQKTRPPAGQPAPKVMVPGVIGPLEGVLALPDPPARPGEVAIRTQKGFYVTAINGGGRTADPIVVTSATSAGPWEKFRLAVTSPSTPHDKSIQTASGNYLTAVNGGGMTANVLHTDATQARDWERFRLLDLTSGNFAPSYYAIQTIKGFYVTALGAGGKYADAIHTDAKQIQAWEKFRVVQCGDPGSGYEYGVMAANGSFLNAQFAGGGSQGDIGLDSVASAGSRFKLIRQGDGSYALLTANGVNFVTALGGGGQVQKYLKCDVGLSGACLSGNSTIFHTDARQVQAWEKFRVIDQGNCTYAIQTVSGFYVGIYTDSGGSTLLTTRRDGASTANEKFQLVVYGLASPVVIQ
jgi:hypothetical protein